MKSIARGVLILSLAALAACVAPRVHEISSSVVQFLYPKGARASIQRGPVAMTLPVNVAIAFVPSLERANSAHPHGQAAGLSAAEQHKLLEKVANHFEQYKFIRRIRIIPPAYLVPGGGWTNLSAIAKMFGAGIVALVSYDQVQRTNEDLLSLTYLTLVGAFVIPGEKNSTSTFVDTAVFDVATHSMLFRAPGISRLYERSTPIGRSGALEHQSRLGFSRAVDKMIANLDKSLEDFRQHVKKNPDAYKVKYRNKNHGGGGAWAPGALGSLFALLVIGGALRRRTRAAGRHPLPR